MVPGNNFSTTGSTFELTCEDSKMIGESIWSSSILECWGEFGREEERDAGDYDRYSLRLQTVNNTCQIVHSFLHLHVNVVWGVGKPQSLYFYLC